MKNQTCCITGHRELPENTLLIKDTLKRELEKLIDRGVMYLTKKLGGTAYTVDYARQKGLKIINLAQ